MKSFFYGCWTNNCTKTISIEFVFSPKIYVNTLICLNKLIVEGIIKIITLFPVKKNEVHLRQQFKCRSLMQNLRKSSHFDRLNRHFYQCIICFFKKNRHFGLKHVTDPLNNIWGWKFILRKMSKQIIF